MAGPHQLVHTGRRWYLLAWDPAGGGWRTFRADRITAPLITGPRFTPRDPPGGDAAAYVSPSISSAPYRYRARIRLHVPASAAAERLPPTAGHLQADGDNACMHTGAQSPDVLAIYVAILGAEFEILHPPELVAHILALAGRLTRAARAGRTPRGGQAMSCRPSFQNCSRSVMDRPARVRLRQHEPIFARWRRMTPAT